MFDNLQYFILENHIISNTTIKVNRNLIKISDN